MGEGPGVRERRHYVIICPMHLYSALLPVLVEALLLFVLSRILFTEVISSFADRRGKGLWLGLLRLPGNLVHELSHALGFLVCGYRVKRLLLCIFDRNGRGSCTPGKPWSPFTFPQLAVGLSALMPLLIGSLILVLIARWLGVIHAVPAEPAQLLPTAWDRALALIHHLDWRQWQTWLFLYFALSIGAELSPSSTDLRYGLPTILVLAVSVWLTFFALHHAHNLGGYEQAALDFTINALTRAGAVLGFALILTTAATLLTILPGLAIRALRHQ